MRQGTIKVREALGPAFPSTDSEIQEALWHYYYDVGKSVSYLKSKKSCASHRRSSSNSSLCRSTETCHCYCLEEANK
jgi:elongation factor 1 alpha-like protein